VQDAVGSIARAKFSYLPGTPRLSCLSVRESKLRLPSYGLASFTPIASGRT